MSHYRSVTVQHWLLTAVWQSESLISQTAKMLIVSGSSGIASAQSKKTDKNCEQNQCPVINRAAQMLWWVSHDDSLIYGFGSRASVSIPWGLDCGGVQDNGYESASDCSCFMVNCIITLHIHLFKKDVYSSCSFLLAGSLLKWIMRSKYALLQNVMDKRMRERVKQWHKLHCYDWLIMILLLNPGKKTFSKCSNNYVKHMSLQIKYSSCSV